MQKRLCLVEGCFDLPSKKVHLASESETYPKLIFDLIFVLTFDNTFLKRWRKINNLKQHAAQDVMSTLTSLCSFNTNTVGLMQEHFCIINLSFFSMRFALTSVPSQTQQTVKFVICRSFEHDKCHLFMSSYALERFNR